MNYSNNKTKSKKKEIFLDIKQFHLTFSTDILVHMCMTLIKIYACEMTQGDGSQTFCRPLNVKSVKISTVQIYFTNII